MARNENPPFPRGQTYYAGTTIDSNNLAGLNLEGKEWVFEDINPNTPMVSQRSNRYVRCRIVRNVAAIALLPKRVVGSAGSGNNVFGRVDGYTTLTAEDSAGVVDEYLGSAGVPVNDLFWMVVEGPCTVLTDLAGGANNVIAVEDRLVALTAVTSGSTTAGRIVTQLLTGATALLAAQIQNVIGRALSAKTTAQSNNDLLIEMGKF